jgi:hypothetical protein
VELQSEERARAGPGIEGVTRGEAHDDQRDEQQQQEEHGEQLELVEVVVDDEVGFTCIFSTPP